MLTRSISPFCFVAAIISVTASAQSEPPQKTAPVVVERVIAPQTDIPRPPVIRTAPIAPPIVAAPRPIPAPTKARPAVPKGLSDWATRIAEHYPSRALREEMEGRVHFVVTIGTNGRVSECLIRQSSGHAVLDEATCANVTRYARFDPALDANGKPTEGSWSNSVIYKIPEPPPPPVILSRGPVTYPASAIRDGLEGVVQFRLFISESGEVTECEVLETSGHQSLDDAACTDAKAWRFEPELDENGRPVVSMFTTSQTYSLK